MFNPLIDNLKTLSDAEVEQKILELSKKYFTASRLGKPELLTQIQIALIMYKEKNSKRNMNRRTQLDDDLDQLINVD